MVYNMNRKPVYKAPAAELIPVRFEESILGGPSTTDFNISSPFAKSEEEEVELS